MTNAIILVKICYKLLHMCHSSMQLIDDFVASADIKIFNFTQLFAMPFLYPRCFCLAYTAFVHKNHYFVEAHV